MLTLITLLLLTVFEARAFGDGYINFQGRVRVVYDEFTTPGTGVLAPGDVTLTFLWNASLSAADPLGSGVPSTGISDIGNAWTTVSSMISDGWMVAQDDAMGMEADVTDTSIGPLEGSFTYENEDGAPTFLAAGTPAGGTIQIVVIGWDNLTGAQTLEQAETANVPMGYSSPFDYTTSSSSVDAAPTFTQFGLTSFGIAPVPEPMTSALAGLGGLSMFFLRRRK